MTLYCFQTEYYSDYCIWFSHITKEDVYKVIESYKNVNMIVLSAWARFLWRLSVIQTLNSGVRHAGWCTSPVMVGCFLLKCEGLMRYENLLFPSSKICAITLHRQNRQWCLFFQVKIKCLIFTVCFYRGKIKLVVLRIIKLTLRIQSCYISTLFAFSTFLFWYSTTRRFWMHVGL